MEIANLEYVSIEYDAQGAGEPVLFIDGSIISDSFLPLMPEPALAPYQLIRYRRRGYSDNNFPEAPFGIQDQATDAAALLEYLGIKKAHIIGHSYGGAIALQLCLDAPEFVQSLVLMEPAVVGLPSNPPPLEGILAGLSVYQEGNSEQSIDIFLKWINGENWEKNIEELIPGASTRAKQAAKLFYEIEIPALGEWAFDKDEASRIIQPVLYLMGSLSVPGIVESKPYLQSWMPQLESYTVSGVNHGLHMQKPAEFANLIAEFIKRKPF